MTGGVRAVIITLTRCEFNIQLTVIELAFTVMLRMAFPDCKISKREYRIEFNHKAFMLQTPCVTMSCGSSFCIWPAMKLPRRPYPVAAYLYAAALYLSTNLSQRQVSQQVKKLFGLGSFSHSTISRAVHALISRLNSLETVFRASKAQPNVCRRPKWTDALFVAAQRLLAVLAGLISASTMDAVMNIGNQLAYQFFCHTGGQFIL
jgi:hypothetical protein